MTVKKLTIAVLAVTAVLAFAQQRPGTVTTITLEDGNDAVLNPDSTWNYVKQVLNDPRDDMFITLRDGRILWLKKDYTYTFTRTMPRNAANIGNRDRNYQPVSAAAAATNRDVDVALRTATNDVYNKAAAAMYRYAPNTKAAKDFVLACLKDDFKENMIEMSHSQNAQKLWRVDAKINLPAHRVSKIIDCVDLQLEPAE